MTEKPRMLYLLMVISLMIILPSASVIAQILVSRSTANFAAIVGTWFLFWALGIRFFTAGLNQVIRPAFTSESIFRIKNPESNIIVRELGFANISTGTLCILSLFIASWRIPAAFVGAVFLGLAGAQHAIKKAATANEKAALVTDLLVFLIMAIYLLNSIF